ncbi:hypothetical protein L7F22_039803 [Adiantum nelumboides]|nr:hypothetical protein [Adiantum nelumboides]
MNVVFQAFFGKSIRVFIDDFCIYSSRALHAQKVKECLRRIYDLGGQLNPDKCHIGEDEVILLGHKVSYKGIEVDPSKEKALIDLPSPKSLKEVISFVQKVKYMSRFIHLASELLHPLQRLTRQVEFAWSTELEEYFCSIKQDPHSTRMRPVYFASRVMSALVKDYTEAEFMMLALIFAVRKFRSYLLPKPFVILTAENLLPWVPSQMMLSSRISKWIMELQKFQYSFKVEDSVRAQLAGILTYKVNGNKHLLHGPRQLIFANGPFEKWGIDAMGPLPTRTKNGQLYILVAIDYMTRWVEVQSVARVNERTVSRFVYTHICCRFGTPLDIVFDNAPEFRKGLLTKICEELHILHRHSTPYYPQSNGLVEKANSVIARIIRKMVKNKTKLWDDFLDGALWAYRTTYREATEFTPFHLVYGGQEALQPIELNIPTMRLHGKGALDYQETWIDRLLTLVKLEWKREAAYDCYKRKAIQTKENLDKKLKDKGIKEGDLVLRYDNRLDSRFLFF